MTTPDGPATSGTDPPPPAASNGTSGVYGITVAAQLAGMSVQALRLYERKGLLQPTRTAGGTRRYSDADIVRLRRIAHLIDDGVNLTGIARILGLEDDNAAIRDRNDRLHNDNRNLRTHNATLRAANTTLQAATNGLHTVPLAADPNNMTVIR